MKLQLDTTNKTIKIEEQVNLKELFELLENILPNGVWKEFKLECNTTIQWTNPITIYPYRPYIGPWWETNPPLYGTDGTNTLIGNQATLVQGTYNLETR